MLFQATQFVIICYSTDTWETNSEVVSESERSGLSLVSAVMWGKILNHYELLFLDLHFEIIRSTCGDHSSMAKAH